MDICLSPQRPTANAGRRTISDPRVLCLYHNAPAWLRLTQADKDAGTAGNPLRKFGGRPQTKESPEVERLYRKGIGPREIAERVNLRYTQVEYIVKRLVDAGLLERHKTERLIKRRT